MWYVLPINPDPWAVGPLGVGKKQGKFYPYIGPNKQLVAFQDAIREELVSQGVEMLPEGSYKIQCFFWRRLDTHASGRKHVADATNMQKATEDAIQKVLIDNDRGVVDIRSRIVEQSDDTEPMIVLEVELDEGWSESEIPTEVWIMMERAIALKSQAFDNTWPPS